ncbi:MAG: hypothetical protein ACK5EO_00995 [Planctomycetota bacterium]|jgi:hypothetical protein
MKLTKYLFRMVLCLATACTAIGSVGYAQDSGSENKVTMADKTIHAQPSYVLSNSQVELAVTLLGGHMAPVTFYRDTSEPIQPYHISPWQEEKGPEMPAAVLVPLRGDFFCMPFGGNSEALGSEKHPPHGEVASSHWIRKVTERAGSVSHTSMTLETTARVGKVTKDIYLVDNQNVVYTKHTIEGFEGKVPLGHHATLAMSEQENSVHLASSPIRFGMTYPGVFSDPKQGEYQSLEPGKHWDSLAHVPVAWKGQKDADLSRLPARQGHADLVQIYNQPADAHQTPAWMTATFTDKGYVWFSLKDPSVLNSTVFWIENRGRHGYPWLGRNHCLGLEDVTAYFADGLKASVEPNAINQQGIKTALELTKKTPTEIRYIQGVVRVPQAFQVVKTIDFSPGQITLVSPDGLRVSAPVNHAFLSTGNPVRSN